MFFYGGRFFGHQEGGGGHAVRNKYSWGQMTREFPVTGEFKNFFLYMVGINIQIERHSLCNKLVDQGLNNIFIIVSSNTVK